MKKSTWFWAIGCLMALYSCLSEFFGASLDTWEPSARAGFLLLEAVVLAGGVGINLIFERNS